MDILLIFTVIIILLAIIFLAIILSIIAREANSPEAKGRQGESKVASILGNTIVGKQYVIHNLLFTDKPNHSCQIDHIFINRYGIWVIETKNYSGTIYGYESARMWDQYLGNTHNTFYNPIKQNTTHIFLLSKLLHLNSDFFHNIVVFLQNADISTIKSNFLYPIHSLSSIKTQPTNTILTVKQMENYYHQLLSLMETNCITEKEHKQNIELAKNKLNQGFCPRCGGTLILRNGKFEKFYGCSNYPSCRFSKNIDP